MRRDSQGRDGVVRTVIFVYSALLSLAANVHGFAFEETAYGKLYPTQATDDSEFGITLAHFKNKNDVNIFLVGSPSDDNQQGALYSCPVGNNLLNGRVPCSKIEIHDQYAGKVLEDKCYSNTTYQRLGASLAVSGEKIMVCAPNWTSVCEKSIDNLYSSPVGTCYTASSDALGQYSNFTPIYYYNNTKSHPRYYINDGYCQVGFSVAYTQQGNGEVVLGAPGCTSWEGDVFLAKPDDPFSLKRLIIDYTRNWKDGVPNSQVRKEIERYVGYTVAEGIFDGRQMVVASAPKEGILKSEKTVFTAVTYILRDTNSAFLDIWATLSISNENKWNFAYCGYSLVVVDIDSDGTDDVAVGCPHYGSDRGAFVIFFQRRIGGTYKMVKEEGPFPDFIGEDTTPEARVGHANDERFASAMAGIGDIDGDGYPEFAVGAPGAAGGRGKVYIYCGAKNALSKAPCQVLIGADGQTGLGLALASGSGLLAVAMSSPNEVAVYRRRKVLLPKLDLRCNTPLPLLEVQAVPVEVCLSYKFRDDEQDSKSRKFLVYLELDYHKDQPRIQFDDLPSNNNNRTRSFFMDVSALEETCQTFRVKTTTKQEAITSYDLRANASLYLPEEYPELVVDPRVPMEDISTLRPALDCDGQDCVSEVFVSMQHQGSNYTYEELAKLYVIVKITVNQDPAYFSGVKLDTNEMLSVSNVDSDGLCESSTEPSCEFDIIKDGQVVLNFTLLPSSVLKAAPAQYPNKFNLTANFTSYSTFTDSSRPTAHLSIPINLDLDFGLTWSASKNSITKGSAEKVQFTFELSNKNSYSYTVAFKVNVNDSCVNAVDLLGNNTQCSLNPGRSDEMIVCVFEAFSRDTEEAVVFSAMVKGKEGCQTPVDGIASFSDLPFGLRGDDIVEAPLFNINEPQAWYEKWWVFLIIALIGLLIINVIIVIVYKMRKPKAQPDVADGDEDASPAEGEDGTAGGHEHGTKQPLDPGKNAP